MSLSRTPSGLAAQYLFYKDKVLVYVEGHTDIPFYKIVLKNYNCRIRTYSEETDYHKLLEVLAADDPHYVVILDGHYEILTRRRSKHRRLVLLHRHSCENYLFEEEPIEQFRYSRAFLRDTSEKLPSSFSEILEDTELKFKELLILDVAHQRAKTGCRVVPKGAEQFFVGSTADFEEDRIQERCSEATLGIDKKSIEEAKTLVREFLKNHRFIDLLPGHFAFSIIRRWINHTVNVRHRILEEDIRVYLSTEVWRLVNTRDHNSLKRRLRRAVREAEKIRQASKSQTQSNTGL
ncbi:MAG: hypothetical protein OXG97_00805 [Candidatus Poribacteria bacterium]|nr:hypothetical protein [Candidatus Poribacteria bacterium]